ncbi:MAG: DUF951 domain-containing protein [Dehalococcoidia bacterium]
MGDTMGRTGQAMTSHIELGDVVELKKKHPCGSKRWQVFRVGADIGIQCLGCGRQVLLERRILQRRIKTLISGEGASKG